MKINTKKIYLSTLILIILGGCKPAWSIQIDSERLAASLSESVYQELDKEFSDDGSCQGLPLETALYRKGFEVVDSVIFEDASGKQIEIDWEDKGKTGCINQKGRISFDSQEIDADEIFINEGIYDQAIWRITDIAPTALSALGVNAGDFKGKILNNEKYEHVVLVFLDGFGYEKYEQAQKNDLVPNLAKAEKVEKGLTVFPSRTSVASAAVMTGSAPDKNGVHEAGIRQTDTKTIFDRLTEAGMASIAVEGDALAFNMRNTEVILSGDRDSNGSTDDNVFANAVEIIGTRMPDLLWIHFHGIDDLGHSFGPDSQEVDDKIFEVDAYFGKIRSALPENTLIIAFADHGMHTVDEGERSGNHGNLIGSDMFIPIIIESK